MKLYEGVALGDHYPGRNEHILVESGRSLLDISGEEVHSVRLNGDPSGVIDQAGTYEYYYDYIWEDHKASGIYFAVIGGKGPSGRVHARAEFAVVR